MSLGDGRDLGLSTSEHLQFQRCPHCFTANPTFGRKAHFHIQPKKPAYEKAIGGANAVLWWHVYTCESCGGLAAAAATWQKNNIPQGQVPAKAVDWVVPAPRVLSTDVPTVAANYLNQARETLSSPAASVVMSASAVDAMLKKRDYKEGTLFSRIKAAETKGLLTEHMADWAHDIRLAANFERHPDEDAATATPADAQRCLEFAETLADLLFVLPARVKRSRDASGPPKSTPP